MNDRTTPPDDEDALLGEMIATLGDDRARALDDDVRASFLAISLGAKKDQARHREEWRRAVARLGEAMGDAFVVRHSANVEAWANGEDDIELERVASWSVTENDGKPVVRAPAAPSVFGDASPLEMLADFAPALGEELDRAYPGLDLETLPESEPARALIGAHRAEKKRQR